ncbi:MAG: glycoside hydrolase, partial [Proteobacteria bacterium]|nr:glycoside hydrolase [Pseudomonadota bacterium]
PDVDIRPESAPANILSVHRRLPEAEVYFLDNRESRSVAFDAVFRVAGRVPQRWDAVSGTTEPLTWQSDAGRTRIHLELGPEESTFVVFGEPTRKTAGEVPATRLARLSGIDGPWEVEFQPGRGAPPSARFTHLASLGENADPRIRYFSGTATYRTSFELKQLPAAGTSLLLDLGRIGDVAEVSVNGKPVGTTWWPPYRLDIGAAVSPGRNTLEVRVANLWVNRLIGDAQPGAAKVAFATGPTYHPDAPLRPSGLMGPVMLLVKSALERRP